MRSNDMYKQLAALMFFAVIGVIATIAGVIFVLIWLIQNVRFA
jgi:hypothetical protein